MKITSRLLLLLLVSISILSMALFALSDSQGEASKPSILSMDDMAHMSGGYLCWQTYWNNGPKYNPSWTAWHNHSCNQDNQSDCEDQWVRRTSSSWWCVSGHLTGWARCETYGVGGYLYITKSCDWDPEYDCEFHQVSSGTATDVNYSTPCAIV